MKLTEETKENEKKAFAKTFNQIYPDRPLPPWTTSNTPTTPRKSPFKHIDFLGHAQSHGQEFVKIYEDNYQNILNSTTQEKNITTPQKINLNEVKHNQIPIRKERTHREISLIPKEVKYFVLTIASIIGIQQIYSNFIKDIPFEIKPYEEVKKTYNEEKIFKLGKKHMNASESLINTNPRSAKKHFEKGLEELATATGLYASRIKNKSPLDNNNFYHAKLSAGNIANTKIKNLIELLGDEGKIIFSGFKDKQTPITYALKIEPLNDSTFQVITKYDQAKLDTILLNKNSNNYHAPIGYFFRNPTAKAHLKCTRKK